MSMTRASGALYGQNWEGRVVPAEDNRLLVILDRPIKNYEGQLVGEIVVAADYPTKEVEDEF